MAQVLSVNVAAIIHEGDWTGSEGRTGIDKRALAGLVRFEGEAVVGDTVVDRKHHGGYDQAVYVYAREDANWWETQIAKQLSNGSFGENLTTEGIDVNSALIGEQWQIGSVLLEVSQPRIPCRVFAGFWQRPTLIKDFTEARRPGAYLRIIQPGALQAGDEIEITFKPDHGISIRDLFEARSGERSKISQIQEVPQLSNSYRDWLAKIEA